MSDRIALPFAGGETTLVLRQDADLIELDAAGEALLLDHLTARANASRDRAYRAMVERRDGQGKARQGA